MIRVGNSDQRGEVQHGVTPAHRLLDAVRVANIAGKNLDAVFDSLRQDSAFLALTSGPDGKLQMPMRNMTGSANRD